MDHMVGELAGSGLIRQGEIAGVELHGRYPVWRIILDALALLPPELARASYWFEANYSLLGAKSTLWVGYFKNFENNFARASLPWGSMLGGMGIVWLE